MKADLDNALLKLSATLGGDYANGAHSDTEAVIEAIRRIESADAEKCEGGKLPSECATDCVCANADNAAFLAELDKRSMSTWTDEEGQRFAALTGQSWN
jgi:hypothetical protein